MCVCVRLSVCLYKKLVILCHKILIQFCCYCLEAFCIQRLCTEPVQDTIFNCLLLLVQEVYFLEIEKFLLTLSQTSPDFYVSEAEVF